MSYADDRMVVVRLISHFKVHADSVDKHFNLLKRVRVKFNANVPLVCLKCCSHCREMKEDHHYINNNTPLTHSTRCASFQEPCALCQIYLNKLKITFFTTDTRGGGNDIL